jgi:peptidyl-prolyl cis-trans isomerase D
MLNTLRRQAGSWVVKILLLLLVASFAVWGIGDIFYGGGQNPVVAEVGDSEILQSELATEFDRVVENVQRRLGTGIDREQAVQLGLMRQALQDLIARRLVDLRAREMGLAVDDDTLRGMIVENPAFQTAGRFDRSRFEQILLANGLSEEGYLAALRQDVLRGTLTDSIAAPVTAPPALIEALYRHRNEQRRGRMIVVSADAIEDVSEPDDAALAAYHAENEQRYTAPELRRLTYVTLEPEDLAPEIAIAEEEIEATYQARSAQYREPERRVVEQVLAGEEDAIGAVDAAVEEGATLGDAAGEVEGASFTELGEVRPGQLPSELEDAIFGLNEGEIGAPVRSPFGWHLFRVVEVLPEEVVPLADVRDAIEEELKLEEANEQLPALANALDDELAAGVSLEEAAATLGLEVERIEAIDPSGRGPEGGRIDGIPPDASFLETALVTPAGETSLLEETAGGSYFVLRVDEITPPRLRPVEEVRDQLVEEWQADERRRLARERAAALLDRLGEVARFDEAARQPGYELIEIEPTARSGGASNDSVNGLVVEALFNTSPGALAEEPVEVPAGFAVVTVDEVIGANPADDPETLKRFQAEVEAEMRSDLLSQFSGALRRDFPVTIDDNAVARLTDVDALGGSAAGVF